MEKFTFEISLSVLNHLGRNLYRSFTTVLGEAISNAWDADAENVNIYIDKDNNSFYIKDDGSGMTSDDFQNKFLKIGYSKRRGGINKSANGRPFIGRKGIGKLALLSCAERIFIISKVAGGDYIGGVIDNSGLDQAITNDLTPNEYQLNEINQDVFTKYTKSHIHGTIIYFETIKEGIRNSLEFLKKTIALYFRFSLVDDSFNIYVDNEKITYKLLKQLTEKTEFAWIINDLDDPFLNKGLTNLKEKAKKIIMEENVKGFIASVSKPRNLRINTTEERVSVDLFVNGRLRERDILKHIPTARVAESYLYGQIHFNDLDDEEDRFTSSRESVIAKDPKYVSLLENFRKKILEIVDDWDNWRIKHRKPGDSENPRLTPRDRTSLDLFNAVSEEYIPPEGSITRDEIDKWVNELAEDAKFNFGSYAECFISENLIRRFIDDRGITLTQQAIIEIEKWKTTETKNKNAGNISIDIRKNEVDLSFLSMDRLANLVDKAKDKIKDAALSRDATEYKPIRDALAHTALLTDEAKKKLTSVFMNIKSRLKTLFSTPKEDT
jgi:hypothetical protein